MGFVKVFRIWRRDLLLLDLEGSIAILELLFYNLAFIHGDTPLIELT